MRPDRPNQGPNDLAQPVFLPQSHHNHCNTPKNNPKKNKQNDTANHAVDLLWNKKFSQAASSEANLHRDLEGFSLARIFSLHDKRTVANDYTFILHNQRYQIQSRSVAPGLRGGKIVVETRLDGRVKALFRGEYLDLKKLPKTASRRSGCSKPEPTVVVEGAQTPAGKRVPQSGQPPLVSDYPYYKKLS